MAVTRRIVLPAVGAIVAAAAIAAAAFAVVSALPQPTQSDRIGVSVLRFLQDNRGRGSRMVVGGKLIAARCRRLSRSRSLVSLDDGAAFVLSGAHVRGWRAGDRALAAVSSESPLTRAAKADLAGSYRLYAAELTRQLENGHRVAARAVTLRGRPAYELELAPKSPRVVLVVDRRTLRPLAARFESARLTAKATLLSPRAAGQAAGC